MRVSEPRARGQRAGSPVHPRAPDRQDGDDHHPEVPGDRRRRRRRAAWVGPPHAVRLQAANIFVMVDEAHLLREPAPGAADHRRPSTKSSTAFSPTAPRTNAQSSSSASPPSRLAGAPRRIEAICLDLIDHFGFIAPNGFKAQVVATSRHAAVTFKGTLDRMNAPESAVIMSAGHNDEARLRWHLRKDEQDRLIERFKAGTTRWPSWWCATCAHRLRRAHRQVMYLDAPLKEHTAVEDRATTGACPRSSRHLLDECRAPHPERRRVAAAPEPARGAVLPGGHRPERPERLRAGAGARGRPSRVRPRVSPVQPVDGHAAAGPARAHHADKIRGAARARYRRPARPLGLRGEGPEADCRRRRRGRRPDWSRRSSSFRRSSRRRSRRTDEAKARDGARHPPRQRPPGRERLLPVAARAAGGGGGAGRDAAALALQAARGAEGRADQGAGHRARRRLRHLRPAGGTAAVPVRETLLRTTWPTATWHRSSTKRWRRSPSWSTGGRRTTCNGRCGAASSASSAPAERPKRWNPSRPTSWTSPRCAPADDRHRDFRGRLGWDGTAVHHPAQREAEEDGR